MPSTTELHLYTYDQVAKHVSDALVLADELEVPEHLAPTVVAEAVRLLAAKHVTQHVQAPPIITALGELGGGRVQ